MLTQPNGGETWYINSTQNIAWNTINIGSIVKIEMSRDNGNTWSTIADTTENDGNYSWLVTGPASNACLVRVTDTGGLASDISDDAFTIMAQP